MRHKIDLRDAETREELGLSAGTVTLPSQHRRTGQEKRDRAETERQILRALYEAGKPLKRLDIARAIGRAKTPWLTSIIESLVEVYVIRRLQSTGRNGFVEYSYEVVE